MTQIIGQSFGRYHIIEQLGEGGMAYVYKAFDTHVERNVALKVILPSRVQSSQFLKRFEREARALASLSHPNIVRISDFGWQDGIPFLVMDYIRGGTLRQRMGTPMPWSEAAHLLAPVARALAYAHSQGIIHRDVKPANILITDSGEPMLSDFGIAKMIEGEEATTTLTGTGVGIGTPDYMAPEQVTGKQVDGRADIYSLGIVLYELVTGRRPFRADTPIAVAFKQATEPLPSPRKFIPNLPEHVEHILYKALEKLPDNRYQTMAELTHALERLAAEGMISDPHKTIVEPARAPRKTADTMAAAVEDAVPEAKKRAPEAKKHLPEAQKRAPEAKKHVPEASPKATPGAGEAGQPVPMRKTLPRWAIAAAMAVVGLVIVCGGLAWALRGPLAKGFPALAGVGSTPKTPTATPAPTPVVTFTSAPAPVVQSAQAAPSMLVHAARASFSQEKFTGPDLPGWNKQGNIRMANGLLVVSGDSSAPPTTRDETFPGPAAAVFQFRYSQDADFALYLQAGEEGSDGYRRWGISRRAGQAVALEMNPQPGVLSGLKGPLEARPDQWYLLLVQPDVKQGEFAILVWEPGSPERYLEMRQAVDKDWQALDWRAAMAARQGTVEIQRYEELSTTGPTNHPLRVGLLDNFEQTSIYQALDPQRWASPAVENCSIVQKDNVLQFWLSAPYPGDTRCDLPLDFASGVAMDGLRSFEARMKVIYKVKGGSARAGVNIFTSSLPGKDWTAFCGLTASETQDPRAEFEVVNTGTQKVPDSHEFWTVSYDHDYIVRLVVDPQKQSFACYLDNRLLGTIQPSDAAALQTAKFTQSLTGRWGHNATGTFFFDDARILP